MSNVIMQTDKIKITDFEIFFNYVETNQEYLNAQGIAFCRMRLYNRAKAV